MFNIGSIAFGRISLEKLVFDIPRFEIRTQIEKKDLEQLYDSFIDAAPNVKRFFYEKEAFDDTLIEIRTEKRPQCIARPPSLGTLLSDKSLPHITTSLSGGILRDEENQERTKYLQEAIEQYPNSYAFIFVPNDLSNSFTKAAVTHEALHYLVERYQHRTGRTFWDVLQAKRPKKKTKKQHERDMEEGTVEMLTDFLLQDDPHALFEARLLNHRPYTLLKSTSYALAASTIFGINILSSFPDFLLMDIIPLSVHCMGSALYRRSIRKKLLQDSQYLNLQI